MGKDRSFSTALHIMVSLAYHSPDRVCSDDLAKGLKTNPGLVRRTISKLAKAGLVDTLKGANGGNTLAKPVDRIHLRDVYLAIEGGPMFNTFEKEPFKPCPVSCQIKEVLNEAFGEVENSMYQKMEGIKLSQLVDKIG